MDEKETPAVKAETQQTKTWRFAKGDIKLEFSLRVDIKRDMEDFLSCMEAAKTLLDEELDKLPDEA